MNYPANVARQATRLARFLSVGVTGTNGSINAHSTPDTSPRATHLFRAVVPVLGPASITALLGLGPKGRPAPRRLVRGGRRDRRYASTQAPDHLADQVDPAS